MQFFKHYFVNVLLIGLFILIFNPISAQSQDENSDSRQTIVYVGFYIKSITINDKAADASIEAYYWFRFKVPKDTTQINQIKNVEFVNADLLSDNFEDIVMSEKQMGDIYYKTGKIKGRFSFISDFRKFPFDKRKLSIQIEHPIFTNEELLFIPDSVSYIRSGIHANTWGIDETLETADFRLLGSRFEKVIRVYKSDFGNIEWPAKSTSYSQLNYTISIGRNTTPYLFKFILPLIFILSAAYLAYFIPAKELDLTIGLGVTALLAAIAFQWTISNDIPSVGYVTSVDKIFILSYFLIILSMVESLLTNHLYRMEHHKLADRFDKAGIILTPILFFGGLIVIVF